MNEDEGLGSLKVRHSKITLIFVMVRFNLAAKKVITYIKAIFTCKFTNLKWKNLFAAFGLYMGLILHLNYL